MGSFYTDRLLSHIDYTIEQIPKEKVRLDTICFCFKTMHIDEDNTIVTGISGIKIEMSRYQSLWIMI